MGLGTTARRRGRRPHQPAAAVWERFRAHPGQCSRQAQARRPHRRRRPRRGHRHPWRRQRAGPTTCPEPADEPSCCACSKSCSQCGSSQRACCCCCCSSCACPRSCTCAGGPECAPPRCCSYPRAIASACGNSCAIATPCNSASAGRTPAGAPKAPTPPIWPHVPPGHGASALDTVQAGSVTVIASVAHSRHRDSPRRRCESTDAAVPVPEAQSREAGARFFPH